MKKLIKFMLLCAIAIVLVGCDDVVGSNSGDTPNSGEGSITPEQGDGQETVDFDVTYTEDFTDGESVDSFYHANYTHSFGSTGVALSAQGSTQKIHDDYVVPAITLSGRQDYSNKIEVSGINGLGTITVNYKSWTSSSIAKGELNLEVDGSVIETLDHYKNDEILNHVFVVKDSNAMGFILKPSVGGSNNGDHRIHIYDVTWTTTN